MKDELKKTESDPPEEPAIPEEERQKILSLMQKMMEMGVCAVYGQEDEGVPDATVDCESNLKWCRSICCTFHFALTKEEVKKGHLKHNPSRPFFIAREEDGYCPHLKRDSLRCTVWPERPLRCRRYDCSEDPQVLELRMKSDYS
jgi:Fe-S-cluster containining protein